MTVSFSVSGGLLYPPGASPSSKGDYFALSLRLGAIISQFFSTTLLSLQLAVYFLLFFSRLMKKQSILNNAVLGTNPLQEPHLTKRVEVYAFSPQFIIRDAVALLWFVYPSQ